MKMKKSPSEECQGEWFQRDLNGLLDPNHELMRLGQAFDWKVLEDSFSQGFSETGRPGLSVRLMVGLHYLKYAFNLSDEELRSRWLENPYWQHFCGRRYFERKAPFDSSSMTRWRKRFDGEEGELLLSTTLKAAQSMKALKECDLKRVNADTTTQEKNLRYPTDARLYDRMRGTIVSQARKEGLRLRQTYSRTGPRLLREQACLSRSRKYRKAMAVPRKLKARLGRVVRDVRRKTNGKPSDEMVGLLKLAQRILSQTRSDSGKVYCVHEPTVECLSKGKPHKKWEFGNKVSFVTTAKGNWIVGAQGLHGSPYDGRILRNALEQTERLVGRMPEQVACDQGYRKHGCSDLTRVLITDRKPRKTKLIRKWLKRRNAIEPIIGHLKAEHRLDRNRLKGVQGDRLNPVLVACGFNFRKRLRFLWPLFEALTQRGHQRNLDLSSIASSFPCLESLVKKISFECRRFYFPALCSIPCWG